MRNIEEIINKLKEVLELKSDTELANYLNISTGAIPNWKRRNKIPFEEIFTICEKIKLDTNYIFFENTKNFKQEKINYKEEIHKMIDDVKEEKAEIYYHLIKAELLKEKL